MINAGDSIYLKAHTGMLIAVPPLTNTATAAWHDYGPWQTLTIEKDGDGIIKSGDSVYMTAHNGMLMSISPHSVVQASTLSCTNTS